MRLHDIAQVCHEANRAIQIIQGDPEPSAVWKDAPQWQRDSAIEGVVKAAAGQSPRELHESWCDFKYATSWVYGEVKDTERLTHPCLVPYDELPEDQKDKDRVFAAIVNTLKP